MKKTNYFVSKTLAITVIVLSFVQCAEKKNPENSVVATADAVASGRLPIAYVVSDSLLSRYNFHKDIQDAMLTKYENLRLIVAQKEEQLNKDFLEFQQKVKNNIFMDEARARQEQEKIYRRRDELNAFAEEKREELSKIQANYSKQLTDTIISVLKEYNKTKKYQMILNTGVAAPILIADDACNITDEVVELLNKKYVPTPLK